MLARSVSVVIPSGKPEALTPKFSKWLNGYDVYVFKNRVGMAKAYNECFGNVVSDIVVLLADDLKVSPEVQEYFDVEPGTFAMLETGDFPINGVQVIWRRDFWRVGGFNEQLLYGSVDHDFYAKAVLAGMRYKPIPLCLVKHIKHETRASTIWKAIHVVESRMQFLQDYGLYFPLLVLKHDFLNRLRRLQFRTLFLTFFLFFKVLVNRKLEEWNRVMMEDVPF